jgi:PAS domain S-box-containing protein
MPRPALSQRKVTSALLPGATAALATAIFVADTITEIDIAIAVLYVAVVLMAARFCRPRGVVFVAAGCVALTVLSYFLSPPRGVEHEGGINTAISIATIGLTTLLVLHRQAAEVRRREQASILDLTHDSIFVRGIDDVITYWNRGAVELYQWERGKALGKVAHQLMQTIFPAPLGEINAELFRTGRWEGELIHTKRDGTRVTVSSRWSLQRDAQGRPAMILETNNDITERKRVEEELRYHVQLLKTVTDNASSALYIVDPAGLGTFVNPSLERITGYRTEELIGQVVHDKIHHTKRDGTPYPVHECPLTGAVQQRRVLHGEDLFVRKDGTFFPVQYTASPIFRDGVAVGTVIEFEDLTERRQAEQALHQAQIELAHVARVMTMGELTASIAHEVNQPLAALVANSNACLRWLARQPPSVDEARDCLHRMIRDGLRAGEVITRIRSLVTKSSPVKVRLDLNAAIQEVLAITGPEARQYVVLVRTELAANLPPVRGDRVQLQQVILNLVMNGIEAMREVADRPRELWVKSRPHEGGTVLVAVQDNGIGLRAESVERIFEAFYTTKAEGMGVGLSITRSIIQAHGGRLWPSANDPHGATIQFTLPTDDKD